MVDGKTYSVAIIGCGRLGQHYATAYSTYPDTEVVAIAEYNSDRRRVVGERFGVKALYPDAESLLRDIVPDIAAVVTPTKYYKDAVIACAESGVKGVCPPINRLQLVSLTRMRWLRRVKDGGLCTLAET